MNKLMVVFWDVDGTLADTEMEGHRVAFNKTFQELQLSWKWNRKLYANLLKISGGGERIRTFAESINYYLSHEQVVDMHNLKQKYYQSIILNGKIPIRVGVKRLIRDLSKNNVQQWIVTTSGLRAVEVLMHSLFKSEGNPFKGYLTAENVSKLKPDPEVYLMALNKSGMNSRNCMVIEDSQAGLTSASGAGLRCLITSSPWNNAANNGMIEASAVLNHLGDEHIPCSTLRGPICSSRFVDIDYLELLLNN